MGEMRPRALLCALLLAACGAASGSGDTGGWRDGQGMIDGAAPGIVSGASDAAAPGFAGGPSDGGAPRIDGRIDEACWRGAAGACDFTTFHPRPGEASRCATEVRWTHDDESLYFAFTCRDPQPETLRARVARRDTAFDDDWVGVILDPDGDGAGAVELLVTAGGSQIDAFVPGSGGDDLTRDFVYRSAAARDAQGWSAELAVPLRSLPQGATGASRLRFFALRHIARRAERVSYPPIDPVSPRWLAGGARLTGGARFAGSLGRARGRLDLFPAVTMQAHRLRQPGGALGAEAPRAEFGATAVGSWAGRLTGAIALRPDFGAVEADAPQVLVNRRFPVFYPEKRPFFLEDGELFELAAEGGPLAAVFHSRAIVSPSLGARATLRAGARDAIACLYADDGGPVGALRWRHEGGGSNRIGLYAAAREASGERSRLLGADGLWLPLPDLRLRFQGLASRDRLGRADGGAGANTPARGAWGHAGALRGEWTRPLISVAFAYSEVSPRFVGAASFLERRDVREVRLEGRRRRYPARSRWRRLEAVARARAAWEFSGTATDGALSLEASAEALGGLRLAGEGSLAGERYAGRLFDAGGWSATLTGLRRFGFALDAGIDLRAMPWYAGDPARQAQRRLVWARATVTPSAASRFTLEAWRARFAGRPDGRPLARAESLTGSLRLQPAGELFLRATIEWQPAARRLTSDWLCAYGGPLGAILQVGYGSLHAPVAERVGEAGEGGAGDSVGDGEAGVGEGEAPEIERPLEWRAWQRDLFVRIGWGLRLGGYSRSS